jgi:hypothetical protein
MSRQGHFPAGQGPDVEVVDVPDAGGLPDGRLDGVQVDAVGHALAQDVDRLGQERPGPRQDPEGDADAPVPGPPRCNPWPR